MSPSEMWRAMEVGFPADGSPRRKLEFAVEYATQACLESKLWNWDCRVASTHLELLVKDTSPLETVDADGRESIIGCGAALVHLKLVLRHFGCLGRVALFPDLGEPALVARVHLGFCRDPERGEKVPFEAASARSANGSHLGEPPLPEAMLAVLGRDIASERGWLDFARSEMSRRRVMEISLTGDQSCIECDPARVRLAKTKEKERYSRWPRGLFRFSGRDTHSSGVGSEPVRQVSVPGATLAVVKTKTDEKHGWLAAGQTMARAVVRAQSLSLSPTLSSLLRRREARETLRTGVGHKGFAQVILSFGAFLTGNTERPSAPMAALSTFR